MSALRAAAVLIALALVGASAAAGAPASDRGSRVQIRELRYVAHDGAVRQALVLLPGWYGRALHPRLPLIISPHGRGADALQNTSYWGDLPTRGGFAVVCPQGQGRRLERDSWGDPGEIADLARMPSIVQRALPRVRFDPGRVYAFGGSMGGQESLLLLARRPQLLVGVAAFDAPTDLALRYRDFVRLRRSRLQALLTTEVGGPPSRDPQAYRLRSPLDLARRIAFSGVPLQLWWSTRDRVVADGRRESGRLFREIRRLNPLAPVVEFVGRWRHMAEMHASADLPAALRLFGLLPSRRR